MRKAAGSSTARAYSTNRPATIARRFTAASPNAPPASSCADFLGRGAEAGSALFRRQLEEAVQFGKAAQFEMPDLPDRPVEVLGEGLRHDQRAVELAAEMLDPAGQVHIGADHGEIEPVAGADIAV